MKKVTETHYCDSCGVEIKNPKVRVYPNIRTNNLNAGESEIAFCFMVGTGGYKFYESEYCSELCFVLHIAKTFKVELTAWTDSTGL